MLEEIDGFDGGMCGENVDDGSGGVKEGVNGKTDGGRWDGGGFDGGGDGEGREFGEGGEVEVWFVGEGEA